MIIRYAITLLLLLLTSLPARAASLARDVGFDQHLAAQVPLDARFRDETGSPVDLRRYIGPNPAVLVMTYFECPNLCGIVLNGLVSGLRHVTLEAGAQFSVVAISIEPRDTPRLASAKKTAYIERYGRREAASGWHFLTGDASQVARVARSIGFRYFYDSSSGQYAHPAGLVILTGQGKVARYLPGVAFPAEELRLALVEASGNRIGTLTDRLWLLCYHYDPATGRYSPLVDMSVRLAALLTVLALGGLIFSLLYRERSRRRASERR